MFEKNINKADIKKPEGFLQGILILMFSQIIIKLMGLVRNFIFD